MSFDMIIHCIAVIRWKTEHLLEGGYWQRGLNGEEW